MPHETIKPELPNKYSDKIDLYEEIGNKLGITREEAKTRIIAAGYGMTKSQFNDVADFHMKFDLPCVHNQLGKLPRSLNDEEALFRLNFLAEELGEYAEASGYDTVAKVLKSICEGIKDKDHFLIYRSERRDLHGQFDALIDLAYVLLGTAQMQALPFDRGFDIVHEKNMQKVRATSEEQSKRGTKLDVIKPLGWSAPDLSELLK